MKLGNIALLLASSAFALPLSLQFARSCVSVMGLDVDAKKVQLLNNGQSYIRHIEPSAIAELVGRNIVRMENCTVSGRQAYLRMKDDLYRMSIPRKIFVAGQAGSRSIRVLTA